MALNKNILKTPNHYINGIRKGDVAVLSRAITLVESTKPEHRVLAEKILTGLIALKRRSFRLGITGVPGVGKSTFIESFGKEVLSHGHKLAVLAVDPSSNKSGGSILGDKTRMEQLARMENVFIRPSPSGRTLGGVAHATYETILLCEAAGFDYIIVETVGVGQSEVAVSRVTDFFLLLMLAGAGDELQGIKRGIMEMADSVVITKADGSNLEKAKSARNEFARAIHMLQAPESGFTSRVEVCSALENTGINNIYDLLQSYQIHSNATKYFSRKRKKQQHELLLIAAEEELKLAFHSDKKVQRRLKQLEKKKILPFSEATKLVKSFRKGS